MNFLFYYFILHVTSFYAMEHLPLELQLLIIDNAPDKRNHILTLRQLNSNFQNLVLKLPYFHRILEEKVENEVFVDVYHNYPRKILPHVFYLKKNCTTQNLYNDLYFERYITYGPLSYSKKGPLYYHFLRQYPNLGCFKDKIILSSGNVFNIILFQSPQKNKICFIDCNRSDIGANNVIFVKHKNIKRMVFTGVYFWKFTDFDAIDHYLKHFDKNIIFQDCEGSTVLHLLGCVMKRPFYVTTNELKNYANIRDRTKKLPIHYAIENNNFDLVIFLFNVSMMSKNNMRHAEKVFGKEKINALLDKK